MSFDIKPSRALQGVVDLAIWTLAATTCEYLEALRPFLVIGLRASQSRFLCNAVLSWWTFACAVGAQIQPLCDQIMSALMECLRDLTASREIKPVIISALGDIALTIGAGYEPYMLLTTMFLIQAVAN